MKYFQVYRAIPTTIAVMLADTISINFLEQNNDIISDDHQLEIVHCLNSHEKEIEAAFSDEQQKEVFDQFYKQLLNQIFSYPLSSIDKLKLFLQNIQASFLLDATNQRNDVISLFKQFKETFSNQERFSSQDQYIDKKKEDALICLQSILLKLHKVASTSKNKRKRNKNAETLNISVLLSIKTILEYFHFSNNRKGKNSKNEQFVTAINDNLVSIKSVTKSNWIEYIKIVAESFSPICAAQGIKRLHEKNVIDIINQQPKYKLLLFNGFKESYYAANLAEAYIFLIEKNQIALFEKYVEKITNHNSPLTIARCISISYQNKTFQELTDQKKSSFIRKVTKNKVSLILPRTDAYIFILEHPTLKPFEKDILEAKNPVKCAISIKALQDCFENQDEYQIDQLIKNNLDFFKKNENPDTFSEEIKNLSNLLELFQATELEQKEFVNYWLKKEGNIKLLLTAVSFLKIIEKHNLAKESHQLFLLISKTCLSLTYEESQFIIHWLEQITIELNKLLTKHASDLFNYNCIAEFIALLNNILIRIFHDCQHVQQLLSSLIKVMNKENSDKYQHAIKNLGKYQDDLQSLNKIIKVLNDNKNEGLCDQAQIERNLKKLFQIDFKCDALSKFFVLLNTLNECHNFKMNEEIEVLDKLFDEYVKVPCQERLERSNFLINIIRYFGHQIKKDINIFKHDFSYRKLYHLNFLITLPYKNSNFLTLLDKNFVRPNEEVSFYKWEEIADFLCTLELEKESKNQYEKFINLFTTFEKKINLLVFEREEGAINFLRLQNLFYQYLREKKHPEEIFKLLNSYLFGEYANKNFNERQSTHNTWTNESARSSIKRLIFFFNKFNSNESSKKFLHELKSRIDAIIPEEKTIGYSKKASLLNAYEYFLSSDWEKPITIDTATEHKIPLLMIFVLLYSSITYLIGNNEEDKIAHFWENVLSALLDAQRGGYNNNDLVQDHPICLIGIAHKIIEHFAYKYKSISEICSELNVPLETLPPEFYVNNELKTDLIELINQAPAQAGAKFLARFRQEIEKKATILLSTIETKYQFHFFIKNIFESIEKNETPNPFIYPLEGIQKEQLRSRNATSPWNETLLIPTKDIIKEIEKEFHLLDSKAIEAFDESIYFISITEEQKNKIKQNIYINLALSPIYPSIRESIQQEKFTSFEFETYRNIAEAFKNLPGQNKVVESIETETAASISVDSVIRENTDLQKDHEQKEKNHLCFFYSHQRNNSELAHDELPIKRAKIS